MTAEVVSIVVTGVWGEPDGTDTPTGQVTFGLTEAIQSPSFVAAKTVRSVPVLGAIAQELVANDADSLGDPLFPATTQYRVVETILGAPEQDYFVTVPAVPPGSRSVSDGTVVLGTQTLVSDAADFTDDDLLAYVLLPQFPVGTQIIDVIDDHTVQLTGGAASATAGGVTVLIGASVDLASLRPQIP